MPNFDFTPLDDQILDLAKKLAELTNANLGDPQEILNLFTAEYLKHVK